MPLLGRYKSSHSSSSSGQPGSQGANSTSSSSSSSLPSSSGGGINQSASTGSLSHTRQVCDSPLFGVRKQISFSGQEDNLMKTGGVASNIITTTTSNQQSINTNLSSSSGGSNSKNNNYNQTQSQHSQLNSIPQQITSQQIHYAFSIMDTNQDGMIDLRDLSQMLANLGVPIDEAILSHIMSSVSKRGDHRISEAEFLDWIAKFIQVSDHGGNVDQQLRQQRQFEVSPSRSSNRLANKRNTSSSSGAPMSRPSTAGFSSQLVAQPVAQLAEVARSRRGSGSGLALMRSLSSSAANTATSTTNSPSSTATSISAAGSAPSIGSLSSSAARLTAATTTTSTTNSANQQDLDAIHDLKAAFCVFDLDADGYITIDEVQAGLKLLGESWSPNELKQLLSKCSSSTSTSSSSSSSSPTSSKSQDLNKLSKRQQEQQLLKKRISIDDFVRMLL